VPCGFGRRTTPKRDSAQSKADAASDAPPTGWEASRSWWGWAAVLFLITAVLLPQLTTWGMFVDGVTYATISRNLALGIGTWWKPCYTETLGARFHEHPPLVFVIQSLFFRLFGERYLVEKAYSLAAMLATLALIPPIMVSLKVRAFYIVPSYPYFALGTALLVAPVLATWVPPAQGRVFRLLHARLARQIVVVGITLLVGLSLCLIGTPRKDRETFHELRALEPVVPRGAVIGTDPDEPPDWLLHAVLHRYLLASLDTGASALDRPFYLAVQGKPYPEGYENTGLVVRNRVLLTAR